MEKMLILAPDSSRKEIDVFGSQRGSHSTLPSRACLVYHLDNSVRALQENRRNQAASMTCGRAPPWY